MELKDVIPYNLKEYKTIRHPNIEEYKTPKYKLKEIYERGDHKYIHNTYEVDNKDEAIDIMLAHKVLVKHPAFCELGLDISQYNCVVRDNDIELLYGMISDVDPNNFIGMILVEDIGNNEIWCKISVKLPIDNIVMQILSAALIKEISHAEESLKDMIIITDEVYKLYPNLKP